MNWLCPTTYAPGPGFVDPRLRRGFDPDAWPLCNGKAAPDPETTDLHERRCLEFLAAYYRLNLLHGRLRRARKRSVGRKSIRNLQTAVGRATRALENLEDRYAPIGFFGDPVMKGLFYRDVHFVRPEAPRISPQSSHIAIPGLADIPASELRGPVKVIRFSHGKVGL
jgi:hypothetical protein